MIDLNDLLKNIDKYKAGYSFKKVRANLDYFVIMEESRKKLQLPLIKSKVVTLTKRYKTPILRLRIYL